jgi:hypothetical protein
MVAYQACSGPEKIPSRAAIALKTITKADIAIPTPILPGPTADLQTGRDRESPFPTILFRM